ncbi:DNA polymerase III subunit alpha [Duodenibacillus massiliensis]|uniref:DNA polymerase III subunit alpha n=1 Tax=Duodenibacillus massiliensis TaxID=1852381 RepID=UPI00307C7BBF
MSNQFVHLRFHSEYSITDGIVRLDPILETAAERGQVALGITDNMNVFGGLRFYTHAIADGIKPIVGCDLWITNSIAGKRNEPYRLTVYCQNHTGYLSLCLLLSRAWMENQYLGRGELKLEWLTPENCKGLICLSGGPLGIIERLLMGKTPEEADAVTEQLKKAFPGRLYLEVQRAGRKGDDALVAKMAGHSVAQKLPLVATHPVQFLKKEDFTAHEVRVCIAQGYVLADPKRPREYTPQQYFKTEEEMRELFSDIPQALENTVVIAQRCNLDGVLQKPQLPVFPTPDGMSLDDYMVKLSKEGLEKRLAFLYPDEKIRDAKRPEYMERLDYELKTIITMKFPGYFLIVQDFINWSKRNGVPVGPGRGSGAGSLVAYCLGITDLDPLHYGLLFERFLNPERVSMPDFDVDFCQHNRDRTIEYVKRVYGADAVSQIVTFGAMGAKAVVRDVGRVLNMGYNEVDRLAKLIPQKPGLDVTLEKAAEMEPDFAALAAQPEYKELMSYAKELEGITRNLGMHAGGVLIAPGKLTDFCPLYNADGRPENTVSQYDKKDVENVGLVKFDFLGLTTLTILGKAVEYIDRLHPGEHFELERIPVDDKETLKLFQTGNTGAVFQFESDGMREQLRQAKPDCLEDLVALNALYRPGPMDQIPHFIDRKFGREKVEYLDQRMEPILRETYGIMVYQEQVMLVARAIGGYSLGGADLLRRAMGKKNVEEMKRQRAVFIKGAAERNVSEETATEIFNLMEKFAGYGFNKSHAAAYSYVAWQTAYLKVHHTACFFAGNLCLVMDQGDKMRTLIDDARNCGVTFLPPDVNVSDWFFTVPDAKTIRIGLGAIKGLGQNIVEDIINERKMNGLYLDIFDLAARVPTVNRKILEQLVRAGAFDSISTDRGLYFENVSQALQAAQTVAASVGQGSLFADENGEAERIVSWKKAIPWGERKTLLQEIEAFGFCLTGDLFAQYKKETEHFATPYKKLADSRQNFTIAGLVTDMRVLMGQRGKIGILTISNGKESQDVFIYAEALDRYKKLLKTDEVLVFTGRCRARRDENGVTGKLSFTASEVQTMEEMRARKGAVLNITLSATKDLKDVAKVLSTDKTGSEEGVACRIDVLTQGYSGEIRPEFYVRPTDDLIQMLKAQNGVIGARYAY